MTAHYLCDNCIELACLLVDCAATLAERATILARLAGTNNAAYSAANVELQRIQTECENLMIELQHHRAEHLLKG